MHQREKIAFLFYFDRVRVKKATDLAIKQLMITLLRLIVVNDLKLSKLLVLLPRSHPCILVGAVLHTSSGARALC